MKLQAAVSSLLLVRPSLSRYLGSTAELRLNPPLPQTHSAQACACRFAILRIGATLFVSMQPPKPHFVPPGFVARAVNRLYGRLASLGLGPSHSVLLFTKGRKTGSTHSTPVNVLDLQGRLYLVGTRGHTQWSRNALVTGEVTLKRGRARMEFRVRVLPDEEKPEVLKAYLTRFNWMVWRFFPLPAKSPASSFTAIAAQYPVFELLPEK